jgi:hypothetical protein
LAILARNPQKALYVNYVAKLTDQFCSQFHPHFMNKFSVPTLFQQLFSTYMYVENAAELPLYEKFVRKMLIKFAPDRM